MAKKKQVKKPAMKKKEDDKLSLGDLLNHDVLTKLKQTQAELVDQEEREKAEELERQREERRQREKDKSFEELLNESSMNWSEFK